MHLWVCLAVNLSPGVTWGCLVPVHVNLHVCAFAWAHHLSECVCLGINASYVCVVGGRAHVCVRTLVLMSECTCP